MRIWYDWLKEYVNFDWPIDKLAQELTMAGFEVAEITDDRVLDLELTVNRADCLSVIGIAREVAALAKKPLKLPSFRSAGKSKRLADLVKISIVDPDLCPRYTGRIIEGIKVGPSPDWLKAKLEKSGISPINNVVDVTNFVLIELGQPMHAFDFHALNNKSIIVCRATQGEKIQALNGQGYELDSGMLIIADTEGPVALAGIIGGVESSVKENTTTVLLECACFDPKCVRKTARQLGIQTESSYRFERGVDIEGLYNAQNRATQLILELCDGRSAVSGRSSASGGSASEIIDEYPSGGSGPSAGRRPSSGSGPSALERISITLRPERVNKVLGTQIQPAEMVSILQRLGFELIEENEMALSLRVPSFRQDISREIDLIEEIARIYGYQHIPTTLPKGLDSISVNKDYQIDKKAKSTLTGCGFQEVITYAFSNPEVSSKAQLPETSPVFIQNPLSEDDKMLSTSLIPNLLEILSWNMNRGVNFRCLKVFELGRAFLSSGLHQTLPVEKKVLCAAVMGDWKDKNWQEEKIETTFYHLKGVVEKLMGEMGITDYRFQDQEAAPPSFHPGRCAVLQHNQRELGVIGQIHPRAANNFKLPDPLYLFELNWDEITSLVSQKRTFTSLPKYPAVVRDLAIVVPDEVKSGEIVRIIEEAGKPLLEEVVLFDLYQGEKIGGGKKSLAYSLTYRDPQTTLRDTTVNKIHALIIQALQTQLNASLRE